MPMSELPQSPVRALSIACHSCAHEMKLLSVVPEEDCIVYAYRCANGHRHEVVKTGIGFELRAEAKAKL